MITTTENDLSYTLDEIVVGERLRKDVGNLSDLDTISDVGLIQPLILNMVDGKPTLVAGGRRITKLRELGYTRVWHGATCDKERPGFVFRDELPEDTRREIELYENLGRKAMTWKERVLSIEEIHNLKCRRNAIDGQKWGMRESGQELGLDFAHVSRIIKIAQELRKPDSTIHNCKDVTSAIRWFVEQKEDEAKRMLAMMTSQTLPPVVSSSEIPVAEGNDTNGEVRTEPLETGKALVVPISRMLHHGKMEVVLKGMPDEFVDNIVTDWPYAIDMDNLQQANSGMDVGRVAAEHDVQENLMMYPFWLQEMYRVLKPNGFCVVWYDNVQWTYITKHAESLGFRVQRWPLVWVKTSPCLNQMAYKNWTKATEFAVVLSKGNAHLTKPQATNYWSGPRATTTSNKFAKPRGLWQWIFSAICTRGETILDPFAGEGSSTLAAIDFGLRPFAVESNEGHYNELTNNVRALYTDLTKGNVKFE
jgi:hypothetical protein